MRTINRHLRQRRKKLLLELESYVISAEKLMTQNKPASNRIKSYFAELIDVERKLTQRGFKPQQISKLFNRDTLIWLGLINEKEEIHVVEQSGVHTEQTS